MENNEEYQNGYKQGVYDYANSLEFPPVDGSDWMRGYQDGWEEAYNQEAKQFYS